MDRASQASTPEPQRLAQDILARAVADLSMIVDRELELGDVHVERRAERPVGPGCVHISFRFGIEHPEGTSQGCVLVPLPEAVSLAGFMMMMSDEAVARERGRTELDGPFKEALLEVGKFLAGACDAVLRQACPEGVVVRPEGCQGVRADVRPALEYREGEPLLVARARVRVHEFEPFELLLVLPALALSAEREVLSA